MARKQSRPTTTATRPFTASSSRPDSSRAGKPKPKARPPKADPTKIYTYVPSLPKRHRTSAQTLSLSRDEAGPSSRPRRRGGDGGEEEDDDLRENQEAIRRVAMRIAGDEVGAWSDGDEMGSEVESDLAGTDGEASEEEWSKAKSKQGKGKWKEASKSEKPLIVDLSEDETPKRGKGKAAASSEEEESELDEDEEENSEGEDDDGGDEDLHGTPFGPIAESDDEEEDDAEDADDDSDVPLPSDLSDEEEDDDDVDLNEFVDTLTSTDKKRKSEPQEAKQEQKKRRVLPVVTGPRVRDDVDLMPSGNNKLDLQTLLASHPSLSSASSLLPKSSKPTSVLQSGVLAAPLPLTVQERLNREAAYEQTKAEGAKWATAMKRIKEAEHLSFPLQQERPRGGVKSAGEVVAGFKPQGEMESAVQRLLEQANLTEKGVKEGEDEALKGQEMSLEELEERRKALRAQRELLFREEAKQKRVAKIKSKTFRKLARKRAAKAGNNAAEESGGEDEDREEMERKRAVERATLRHGVGGRWAREQKERFYDGDGGGGGEGEGRRAREEMLERKERLTRRIQGRGDGGSDEGSDDATDDDDNGGDDDEEEIKARAFDQLAKVNGAAAAAVADEGKKGLMQMKFMQNAREREGRRAAEAEREARRDIEMFGEEGEEEEDDQDDEGDGGRSDDEAEAGGMMNVGGNEGRMVFSGPAAGTSTAAPQPSARPAPAPVARVHAPSPPPLTMASQPAQNPWLVAAAKGASGPSRKRNAPTVLSAADKAREKLRKAAGRGRSNGEADDDRVEIDVDGGMGDGSGSEGEGEGGMMPAFKQRELVAEAFAGDNVVEDFVKEKARQVQADAPTIEDTSLVGWGSWGGKGVKRRKTHAKFLVKTAGVEPAERRDFGKNNVIISERAEKRAEQFLAKDLPYPYTSKAQYEKQFDMPLGKEWNARGVHQRETMPRVVKKPGAIIEPIRRLF